MRSILSQRNLTPLPGSRLRFFIAMQIQYLLAHLSTAVLTGSAQNPGFEIVREESVKVYLNMHNGNVPQNPLCVESCVTNGFSISPRLSPTMFDPDANSVLTSTPLYIIRLLCAEKPVFEIVQESVIKVCTTRMSYLHTFIQQQY